MSGVYVWCQGRFSCGRQKCLLITYILIMFDEFVLNLPDDYNLWCDIEQIGGFTDLPKEICPNENIRIYSVYQQKNE